MYSFEQVVHYILRQVSACCGVYAMFSETCAITLALLLDCTIIEKHAVIWFLWSVGVKPCLKYLQTLQKAK